LAEYNFLKARTLLYSVRSICKNYRYRNSVNIPTSRKRTRSEL